MTGEKTFTLPVFALILLSFILGTSEFVIIGILPDIAAGIDCSIVMVADMPYVGFGGVVFMLIALFVNLKLLHIMADIKKRPHISRS